jgi:hypothetical protein
MMDSALDASLILLRQLDWSFDFDPKIVDARHRLFDFVGGHSHLSSLSRQLEFVPGRIESRARGQRRQQQLRRLVTTNGVLTGFHFELHRAEMIHCNFQHQCLQKRFMAIGSGPETARKRRRSPVFPTVENSFRMTADLARDQSRGSG